MPYLTKFQRLPDLWRLTRFASLLVTAWLWLVPVMACAHGFTADVVDIKRLMNGKYRIIIFYTHLGVGEYRRAHIDYSDERQAREDFQKLVRGADFFIGKTTSVHFHDEPEQPTPF